MNNQWEKAIQESIENLKEKTKLAQSFDEYDDLVCEWFDNVYPQSPDDVTPFKMINVYCGYFNEIIPLNLSDYIHSSNSRKMPNEIILEILFLRFYGVKINEINKIFNVTYKNINTITKKFAMSYQNSINNIFLDERLNKAYYNEIIKYYKSNSIIKTSKKFKTSDIKIKKILNDNEVYIRNKVEATKFSENFVASNENRRLKFSENDRNNIIERYIDGDSCSLLARDYNVSWKVIGNFLVRNGIKIRDTFQQQSIDRKKGRHFLPTSIEVKCSNWLDKNVKPYFSVIPEFHIPGSNFIYDFRIKKLDILIEIDGCYIHKNRKEKDLKKTKAAKEFDHTLIRISETEIKQYGDKIFEEKIGIYLK